MTECLIRQVLKNDYVKMFEVRDRNKAMKTEIKTSIRKVLEALSEKDVSTANDLFKLVAKKADQAATSKTIHKNKAARIKSRLSARIVKTAQSAAS
jgi:small subunit ribosomal protein S20